MTVVSYSLLILTNFFSCAAILQTLTGQHFHKIESKSQNVRGLFKKILSSKSRKIIGVKFPIRRNLLRDLFAVTLNEKILFVCARIWLLWFLYADLTSISHHETLKWRKSVWFETKVKLDPKGARTINFLIEKEKKTSCREWKEFLEKKKIHFSANRHFVCCEF